MSLDSLLKTGTTYGILSADGRIPFKKDLFISSETGNDMTSLTCFIILLGKLFGPVFLLIFKS